MIADASGRPSRSEQLGTLDALDTKVLFWRLSRTGDQQVRDELVRRYMPLARKLASRYINANEPLEDLIQVAMVGLIAAVDRFDPDRGTAFTSFAIPTILGELKRHFRAIGWSAHVPRRSQELALKVEAATREATARTGRSPSVPELAQYLELSTEQVLAGLEAISAHYSTSLDAPVQATGSDSVPEPLIETLGAEDQRLALSETRMSISVAMRRLPFLEREALTLRLQDDLKQTEIADRLGCSQMQVSRLLRRAAARVRKQLEPRPGTNSGAT
jgi:RNA polymerase sigma-B factor